MIPLLVACLLVWGDRIMNKCFYTMLIQILLQLIPTLTENRKLMVNVILIIKPLKERYYRIVNMFIIIFRQLLALPVIFIQIFQLHVKYGSICFCHPTVDTSIFEYIFFFATIIGQRPDNRCEFCIISCYSTCITKGTKILSGVKTMSCSIA